MATISAVGGAKGESQLEIRLLTGEILIKKSYASEDGQHGEIVDQVEWTPDSQFLVYSMYSSGGHQPWHSPIDFYSRKQNAVINLEARVALIADPEFHVIGPGVIELFGKDTGAEAENSWFRVDLREQR